MLHLWTLTSNVPSHLHNLAAELAQAILLEETKELWLPYVPLKENEQTLLPVYPSTLD